MLKHTKVFILLLFLLYINISSSISFAQTAQANDNLKKYWYYRYRLRNDFTLMGDGQGKSIIAAQRKVDGALQFNGDQTSVMGEYMAVLATEYQLLKNNGQDVSRTLEELYYLLKALSRLDETAESFIRNNPNGQPYLNYQSPLNPQSGDLNGFFMRDDVLPDFVQNNSLHFNSGKTNNITAISTRSGFANADETRRFESLDQVINLMIGLSFVSKYVNDTYQGKIIEAGESNMQQMARNFTDRMIMYIKNNNWRIQDPITGYQFADNEGGFVQPLAYGFAETANKIQGNNNPVFLFLGIPVSSANYHDAITALSFLVFGVATPIAVNCEQDTGILHSEFPCSACFESYKLIMLGALGNCLYNSLHINITASRTAQYASNNNIEIIPLIRQVLHGGVNFISNATYENLLDRGPLCGPKNWNNCNYDDFEWSSFNRWRASEKRGMGCPAEQIADEECTHNLEPADYPGIDYMMLFNMFCLAEGDNYMPNYINYMDRIVNIDFPFTLGGTTIGDAQNPATVNAYKSVTLNGNVNPNANVTFRAGTEINVEAGSYCDYTLIHIDPFGCSNIFKKGDSTQTNGYGIQDDPLANLPHYHVDSRSENNAAPTSQLTPTIDTVKVKSNSLKVYPNPTTGEITLNYKLTNNCDLKISIYNSIGQEVKIIVNNEFRQAGEYIVNADVSTLQQGMYFYLYQTSTGVNAVRPLIISK